MEKIVKTSEVPYRRNSLKNAHDKTLGELFKEAAGPAERTLDLGFGMVAELDVSGNICINSRPLGALSASVLAAATQSLIDAAENKFTDPSKCPLD